VQDPEVRAVEDLDDDDFSTAAVFLSRLLARRTPPMDVEHVVIQSPCDCDWTNFEIVRKLMDFGQAEAIWSADEGETGTVDAFTLNRPSFFDPARIELPEGISARWDGPVKVRGYYQPISSRMVLAFICFPTLDGSSDAWAQAVAERKVRFGAGPEPLSEPTKGDLEQAYVDICTNVSVELLRHAVEAGLLEQLRMTKASGLPQSQMVSVFGPRRGRQLTKDIGMALRLSISRSLFPSAMEGQVPAFLDPERPIVHLVDRADAREAVLAVVPSHWIDESDEVSEPVSYMELLRRTAPADECSISCALDYELDVGTVQPANDVRQSDEKIILQRAFWRGEYDGKHLHTYDDVVMRRTRVVCTNTFALWLRSRNQTDEGELNIAKLYANLVHDWGSDVPPLAMQWTAWKFGAVPNLPPPADRYLLPILVRSGCLSMTRATRDQRRYSPKDLHRWTELFKQPLCSGTVTARVKGLVKAYSAIQRRCKSTRELPSSTELKVFSDPLVVLASARNEQTAYICAQFEILLWIQIGVEQFFPNLSDAASLSDSTAALDFLRPAAKEFAQAARFLYEKLGMYRNLPELRRQVVEVFEQEALEAGDIILDTIESPPRFSRDPLETRYPVGLLEWAVDIIRPFTSLLRQVLTAANIERDTRKPDEREFVSDDGVRRTKDAGYYLQILISKAPELSSTAAVLQLAVDAIGRERCLTPKVAEALRSAFLEIVKLLKARLPDLENPTAFDDRRQRRDGDLIKCSRLIAQRSRSGYVAVGDFYNFARLATVAPFAADAQDIAERIQEWIQQSAESVVASGTGDVHIIGINSDTVVLAGPHADEVVLNIIRLRERLTTELHSWDEQVGNSAIHFMRFGIAQYDSSTSGATAPMPAVVVAYRLAERHGSQRGSIIVTSFVRKALSDSLARAFPRESEWKEVPSQGSVWSWNPGEASQ